LEFPKRTREVRTFGLPTLYMDTVAVRLEQILVTSPTIYISTNGYKVSAAVADSSPKLILHEYLFVP
jgi:hypothetical protein